MRVKKFPMILALHLKRFKYVEQYNRHIKVSHRVVFPFELRLYDTVSTISSRKSWISHSEPIKYLIKIAEWWHGKPSREAVRPCGCGNSLWQRSKPRPLHQHSQKSQILVALWWWHGWCEFWFSPNKIEDFCFLCGFFCRKLMHPPSKTSMV